MLVSFTVDNFLSFGTSNTLSFLATPVKGAKDTTFLPPSYKWDYRLLRSIGILGFNASGKTNFLKAVAAMRYAVLYSGSSSHNVFEASVSPFLLKKENLDPSTFEAVFFLNDRKYRYGFKILNNMVSEEWLFYAEPKIRENCLFHRKNRGINFNKNWNKEVDNSIETLFKRVQDQVLFISVLGVLNVQPAVDILKWFGRIIVIESFDAEKFIDFTSEHLQDESFKYNFLRILKEASLGFKTIVEKKVSEMEKGGKISGNFMEFMIQNEIMPKNVYNVLTIHPVFDEEGKECGSIKFDLKKQESSGTKKFFGLVGLLLDSIIKGKIILFDELDSQFHFAMYETLVALFNNSKINPKGAQMIFTSHNTTLLKKNKIRRDQLYTLIKDIQGKSMLKRVHEKGSTIRTDASLEKEYMEGDLKTHPHIDFNLFTGILDFPGA